MSFWVRGNEFLGFGNEFHNFGNKFPHFGGNEFWPKRTKKKPALKVIPPTNNSDFLTFLNSEL